MKKLIFLIAGALWLSTNQLRPTWAAPTVPDRLRIPATPIKPPIPEGNFPKGGPVSNDMRAQMEKMDLLIQDLVKQNADLKQRLAVLETKQAQDDKNTVAFKLVITGMDTALGTTNKTVAANQKTNEAALANFKSEYAKHTHQLNFTYQSFKFLNETPGNNKGNFYVPYIWLNSKPSLSQIEKEQSVQPYLNKTTPPVTK